jgi:DNA-binding Lrp family transcriptional regulator
MKRITELEAEGVIVSRVVVNPIKVFENVILSLMELETLVIPKDQLDKEYGLKKVLQKIQENFPELKVIFGFVAREGEYDLGLMIGVNNTQRFQELMKKLSEAKLFKKISNHSISASEKFYFNPIAFPDS